MPFANAKLKIFSPEARTYYFPYRDGSGNSPITPPYAYTSGADQGTGTYLSRFQQTTWMQFNISDYFNNSLDDYLLSPAPPYDLNVKLAVLQDPDLYLTGKFAVTSATIVTDHVNDRPDLVMRVEGAMSNVQRSASLSLVPTSEIVNRRARLIGDLIFRGGLMSFIRTLNATDDAGFEVYADIDSDLASGGVLPFDADSQPAAGYDLVCMVRYDERIKPNAFAEYQGVRYRILRIENVSINRFLQLTLSSA